ncbi:S41 family peptidase [Ulvibacterium sp.]|uniref:S41 family peptidase n=1 Tax=Ulvibacterium sp. TaxID=2665914 RepID=UPI003BA8653B
MIRIPTLAANVTLIKILLVLICLSLMACTSKTESRVDQQKVENLIKFAEIYGIVKYFHPSDEAYDLDWNKFAIYSTEEILKCETQEQFSQKLDSLFLPIVPASKFEGTSTDDSFSETFWHHQGVGFGMKKNGLYFSERLIVNEATDTLPYRPKLGDAMNIDVLEDKSFTIPIVLLRNESGTLPKSNPNEMEVLNRKLKKFKIDENGLAFRLGNLINVYNVFQHFFPYLDVLSIDWQQELRNAIVGSFVDSSKSDHVTRLQKFTAPLQDGHISIDVIGEKDHYYYPPISWEWIQNKLIITRVWNTDLNLKVGDEVSKVNGQDSKDYFDEMESRISSGTKGWLRYRSENESLRGKENSKLIIQVDKREIVLKRNMHNYDRDKGIKPYEKLHNNIHYLNLTLLDWQTMEYLLPELEKSNGIICDLRGYPNGSERIVNHLLKKVDTAKGWLRIPKIVFPNQKKITNYVEGDWTETMIPAQPYLGDKNIVFITNGSAISYAESIMGFVKGYKLATIVGQPTAGTNGNYNIFTLPGNIQIKWTGMQVLKLDGTQLYGIGILPDVYVEKTVDGLINHKDEFLDKGLKLVNKKISAANIGNN